MTGRPPPLVTLTTDFGAGPYVAQLKGALLTVCPGATIVDVAHDVPPHDVTRAAWLLHDVVGTFPPGTVHVVVVDPGVGTRRRAVVLRAGPAAPGQLFVGPDNGSFGAFAAGGELRQLDNRAWRRPVVSPTFHGRDIFAPAAGHLARGDAFEQAGPRVDDPLVLELRGPLRGGEAVLGEVVYADAFGNLVTNIAAEDLPEAPPELLCTEIGAVRLVGFQRTYGDVAPGSLLVLVGSAGRVEVAVREGSARSRLRMTDPRGVPVKVSALRPM